MILQSIFTRGAVRLRASRSALVEFLRYAVASLVALALDFSLLLGLTELAGWHYLVSAAVGFTAGSIFLYVLSTGFIFRSRRLQNRQAEFMVFAGIGVIGLVINQSLMFGLVSFGGLAYPLAKIATVMFTFLFNFGMRKTLLFKSPISAGV